MKCNEIRNLVLAYLDSELDAQTSQEIELHLQTCAECAELFAGEEKFNGRLFGVLRAGQPTPALWEQIESRLRPQRRSVAQIFNLLYRRIVFCEALATPTAPRVFNVPPIANRRYSRLKTCATVFAALIVTLVAAWFLFGPSTTSLDLAKAVEKDHREFLQGKMTPEFSGALPDEIAKKMGDRLDAAAFAASPDTAGFTSEGARLCHLADVPVAWTLGRYQQRPLSLIVFNRDELDRFPQTQRLLESGEPVACSRAGRYLFGARLLNGYVVCMVGELKRTELEAMLKTVRIPTG